MFLFKDVYTQLLLLQNNWQFAENNNLPYRRFPLIVSLKKHYRLLKNNSFNVNPFEEVM